MVLPAGEYRAYYLALDGYSPLTAPVDFEVVEAPPGVKAVVPSFGAKSARVGSAYSIKVSGLFEVTGGGTPKLSIAGPRWASLRADGTFAASRNSAAPTRSGSRARLAGQMATTTIRVPVVAASQPLTSKLNVMSYNTWHGGTRVYQGQMKEIRGYLLADVDAVGMQEAGTAETQALADRLGWSWYQGDGDTAIISRYPIIDTAEAGEGGTVAGARISVDP